MSLNLKTEKSSAKFKSNADIEDVLSGNYSLGNDKKGEAAHEQETKKR